MYILKLILFTQYGGLRAFQFKNTNSNTKQALMYYFSNQYNF